MKREPSPEFSVDWLAEDHERAALLDLFMDVADAEGWQPGSALYDSAPRALHLAATAEGLLLGGAQVVLPASGPLPYAAVWPEVELTAPARTAHITVLALRATGRGRPLVLWSLCAELWRSLVAADMESVILEATPDMLAKYCRLGFPLSEIGALRLHFGEPCLLAQMDLRAVGGAMLIQAGRSPVYRTLIERAIRPTRVRACEEDPALP